jgi:LmbE family N-acetylglucosaminyl deacetylase
VLRLPLPDPGGEGLRVLCLGAHPDDIEIGCGGTVLALARARPDARFHWVVLAAGGGRRREAEASAAEFLAGGGGHRVVLESFRDGFLPYEGGAVKERFERLKGEVDPHLVLTHARRDRHQDHRLVCELTWNTFRDHLILEYEIPKYDGDLGAPNLFVPLSRELAARKVELLLRHFGSQRSRDWFDAETFHGLMRLRGVEARSPSGLAEAFHAPKLALALGGS